MRKWILILFVLATPVSAQFFGGGPGAEKATAVLCQGSPCSAGSDVTNRYIVTRNVKPKKCYITAKVAPAGGPLTIDVKKNGTTIFGATKLVFPAAGAGVYTQTTFAVASLAEGDLVSFDIVSPGLTSAAQDVTAVCVFN